MMKLVLSVLVACLTLVTSRHAAGQFWGGGFHASTAAEGAANGMANIMTSAGAANLSNSAAAINYEQARSSYIDNRLKNTKTYFEMKQVNNDYRDANRTPRPTSEQLFRLAKDATPSRLDPTQLDPVTGMIMWPEILKADEYTKCRDTLDGLFQAASQKQGKLSADEYKAIRQAIADVRIELRNRVNDYPPQVFSKTSAFLQQLDYEVRMRI